MKPGISKDIVAPVIQAMRDLGFTAELPRAEIVDGGAADAAFDAAAKALSNPAVGIEVARRIPIGALGMLDYALCMSSTLREGLERTARNYAVVTQRVRLSLSEEAGVAWLRFDREPGQHHSRHWIEFASAMFVQRIRVTLGEAVALQRVSFLHPAPPSAAVHDAYFGVSVVFGAPQDTLAFEARLLNLPLRTASSAMADVLELKLQALAPAREPDSYLRNAHAAVEELLDQRDASLDALVSRLHTSRRTLQRELGKRGTSHQTMVDNARRTRAQALLSAGASVADIAQRLGYSEPSAFFRAFRRWTGRTPKQE